MKALLVLLAAGLLLTTTTSHAKLQPLTDAEMSNVYGTTDIAANLIVLIEQKLAAGQPITGEEIMANLQLLSKAFGVSLENITIVGEKHGGLQMSLIRNGQSTGTVEMPSHFDRIHIGSIRIGGTGASLGSLTIENISITGQIRVTVH